MKTKSTRYVHLYDAAQLQAWLEDRAAAGWLLEDAGGPNTYGISLCFAHFVRGEGRAIRYRLVPMRTEGGGTMVANIPEPGRDMLELYEGMGWRYVCNLRDFYVFAAEDPAVPEPFTDADSWIYSLEKMVKYHRNCLIATAVLAALRIGKPWLLFVMYALTALLSLRRFLTAKKRLELAKQGELEDREAYRNVWYLRWGDALLNLAPWLILLAGFVWAWAELAGG